MKEFLKGFLSFKWVFRFLADVLNGIEKSVMDFISAVVPYAVPVIPAYLTYYHTIQQMNFPPWVASTAAFVVEALGLASVSTAIRFWRNNQKYKSNKSQNRAPFKLAIMVYAFYIVIVLLVNVVLEVVADTRSGWVITAIGAFSLLSFPSGVLISIRMQYADMLEERAEKKPAASKVEKEKKPKYASHYADQILEMLNNEHKQSGRVLAPKEITARLKLDHDKNKGFVSSLTTKWKTDNDIKPFGF